MTPPINLAKERARRLREANYWHEVIDGDLADAEALRDNQAVTA